MKLLLVPISLLCASLTLSACAGGPTSTATATGSSTTVSREAATWIDTYLCIENLSSVNATVTFDSFDLQSGQGVVTSGAKACASGSLFWEHDVEGKIYPADSYPPMWFGAKNPLAGFPTASLKSIENQRTCAVALAIGVPRIWDDGLLMYELERKPDGANKEFVITIRNSAKPSADGKPRPCRGGEGSLK
jgi:hypothetical protein